MNFSLSDFFLYLGVIAVFVIGKEAWRHCTQRSPQIFYGGYFIWVSLLIFIGHSGLLGNFDKSPPPFAFFVITIMSLPLILGLRRAGAIASEKLSVRFLILAQSFRLLAELVIYFGWREGRAPIQLSFHGYNFDIAVALLALAIGSSPALYRKKWIAWIFNTLGIISLIDIAFIAITSMPTPIRLFMEEPDNRWVTQSPSILLPGVLVTTAIFLHVILTRKLLHRTNS